jgi:glutamate synthase (NADPH/NADH) small chain
VHQLELLPRPPDARADNPWPQWPNIFRVSSAHEEGGERVYRWVRGSSFGETSRIRPAGPPKIRLVWLGPVRRSGWLTGGRSPA